MLRFLPNRKRCEVLNHFGVCTRYPYCINSVYWNIGNSFIESESGTYTEPKIYQTLC